MTWFLLCQTTSWVTIPIYYPLQLYRRKRFETHRVVTVDMESDKKKSVDEFSCSLSFVRSFVVILFSIVTLNGM